MNSLPMFKTPFSFSCGGAGGAKRAGLKPTKRDQASGAPGWRTGGDPTGPDQQSGHEAYSPQGAAGGRLFLKVLFDLSSEERYFCDAISKPR